MSAHTKGPWVWYDNCLQTKQGGVILELQEGGEPTVANANVIGSAPELLEALQTLVMQRDGRFSTPSAWESARAALAKAQS